MWPGTCDWFKWEINWCIRVLVAGYVILPFTKNLKLVLLPHGGKHFFYRFFDILPCHVLHQINAFMIYINCIIEYSKYILPCCYLIVHIIHIRFQHSVVADIATLIITLPYMGSHRTLIPWFLFQHTVLPVDLPYHIGLIFYSCFLWSLLFDYSVLRQYVLPSSVWWGIH